MQSIRDKYSNVGIETLYKSGEYNNPHEDRVINLLSRFKSENKVKNKQILDLCCGNGEVTKIFMKDNDVVGCDPYTYNFYKDQVGLKCFEYSFNDIAFKNVDFGEYNYIICSYALHLCEKESLSLLLYKLSLYTKDLVIVSPSDVILERVNSNMNWQLYESYKYERSHLFHFKFDFN